MNRDTTGTQKDVAGIEFTDGSLNAIAQKMLGDGSSATGSREQQIEELARGEY